MVTWEIVYTKKAEKDAKKIRDANLKLQAKRILDIVKANPYGIPPPFEKLSGNLKGHYSRRINLQHRLVYEIFAGCNTVKIHSMFTHYER